MGLTFEKVWAALMELREDSKETDRQLKETDRLIQELREESKETDRQLKETGRLIRESQRETDQLIQKSQRETDRLIQESHEKAEREIRELREKSQETDRVVKETSRSVGILSNSFGELAEHLVAPSIHEKFNALGYHFKGITENQRIRNEQGQTIAEIDILLENNDYIVAVEVKSKPKNADIDNFAKRLDVLRKYRDENHDKRRIHGAIAGAVFHDSVKSAVLKAGFYVIEQTGDTVKIDIPEGFKPREW
jgi:chromosome segregation ATPase